MGVSPPRTLSLASVSPLLSSLHLPRAGARSRPSWVFLCPPHESFPAGVAAILVRVPGPFLGRRDPSRECSSALCGAAWSWAHLSFLLCRSRVLLCLPCFCSSVLVCLMCRCSQMLLYLLCRCVLLLCAPLPLHCSSRVFMYCVNRQFFVPRVVPRGCSSVSGSATRRRSLALDAAAGGRLSSSCAVVVGCFSASRSAVLGRYPLHCRSWKPPCLLCLRSRAPLRLSSCRLWAGRTTLANSGVGGRGALLTAAPEVHHKRPRATTRGDGAPTRGDAEGTKASKTTGTKGRGWPTSGNMTSEAAPTSIGREATAASTSGSAKGAPRRHNERQRSPQSDGFRKGGASTSSARFWNFLCLWWGTPQLD